MLIGELSKRSGISRRMLRHYDDLDLVTPSARSPAGYREYSEGDVRRLLHVESLRSLGLSLAEVAQALDDPEFDARIVIAQLVEQVEERITREQQILSRLRLVAERAPTSWNEALEVMGLVNALRSDEPRRRLRAALVSSARGDRGIRDLVEAQLSETETNVAGALEWAIARGGEGAVDRLRSRATDGDAVVRANALRALAQIEGRTATAALKAFLADPDSGIRGGAALALGRRGVTESANELVAMVVEGRSDVDAAETLGELAAAGHEREITRALLGTIGGGGGGAGDGTPTGACALVDPPIRRRIVQALAELPGAEAMQALSELEHDDDPQVALTARSIRLTRARHDAGEGR